ncbi:MAG: starch-binding protein, partial [Muribaculaceae bacterium]|nr:starch-binding protein [Muribaculaceae bacterium]
MNRFSRFLAGTLMATTAFAGSAATFVGDRDDFRDETIYFAMTTRFYDGDPANNVCGWDHQNVQIANNDPDWRGDFKGLIDKLDYIKALGFTAIWITPIVQNASGTDFHGYHAMDMSKVDLRYESRKSWGSSEDVTFQSLIDAAHAKGMKIVLDIVLNHTGNFGEVNLNPLFTRSEDIRNQADVTASLTPNYDRLPSNYNDLDGEAQYAARFKYFKQPQYDTHNYYHHYGTGWNWDLPNRWWGQIAGDCVDLNTENNTVADYLVECYGKFIEMGVDGFRIDTTGHISRLTFNKQFIPRFIELGEKYKSKRLNGCPFYMFGECCARFGGVIYRDQHNLSSHYYTWKSPQSLLDAYDGSQAFWDTQVLPEGHDSPVGPMALCEQETAFDKNSDNVFMKNGAWHEPDYSDASGYNVIDFPMHYNFNSAEAAVNIAKEGDHYYNDASYNVVYVDSHDYCPGPNDGTRFNGGTAQWAENLALMFTFRGIPCIYYGSEVEFMKGAKVDAGGTDMPVGQSGRAYFGHYIEGSVNASDFGEYTATGNAAQTLNADLAQHIIRLNKIRAAVPALRKGQYTFDGCSANGGFAFKRAYKDSYALVAINGGATFTNVPAGTYTDLVTGQTYQGGGSITVSAPNTQGQLRVLVKDWTGGKVGTDGQFIYASSPVAHGGSVSFSDPGASQYYTADDAIGNPSVNFSPAGGSFKTETLTVTATLAENAVSGWYKVGDNAQVNLTTAGQQKTFTVGDGMGYGDSVTVTWGAKNSEGTEFTGKATYKKVDPNAAITVYVTSSSAPYVYAWGEDGGETVELNGKWPGKQLTESTEIDGKTYYYVSFDSVDSVNVIFSNGSQQTGDITGITGDTYYSYSGDSYEVVDVVATPQPSVTLSPNGGRFTDTLTVSISSRNATSAWYKIGNGAQKYFTGSDSFTLGGDMADGESVTVTWSATDGTTTKTGSATYTKAAARTGYVAYFNNSQNWGSVYAYTWSGSVQQLGAWPGTKLTETEEINGKLYYV